MPVFAAPEPLDVTIAVGVGHVEVVASDRDDAVVEVLPSRPRKSGDVQLAQEAAVELDGGHLRVRVPRRLTLFGRSDSVDVRVEVPTGSRLDVDSAYGAVRTRGVLGPSRITAKYGEVTADTVHGLTLVSPYGTVEIGHVAGPLDVTAGHGEIRIDRVDGEAHLRGSHGSIALGTTAGPVEVTTSGAFTVDHALTDVHARSAHGAIRVREVTSGVVRLENAHAGVEVGVPAGVAAWLDAASEHGTVRNTLTPDPDAATSGRTVELHLSTGWADVVVRRARTPKESRR